MAETNFVLLLQKAFETENPDLFNVEPALIYKEFELAEKRLRSNQGQSNPQDNLHFKFEKVRLGVATALMQVFSEMADDDDSRKVLEVLKRAARGTSTAQMDAIINKDIKAFDSLYKDLFINDEGEILLGLFERTLHADSKAELDQIIREGTIALDQIKS